ncbi:hypothetical protein T310_9737 [Rasamsonia emersonii CBS 393.64]|uniref:Uncharacterized protein n=1 Tax=Rasamsonia emersonii (strain ATCC 16479 / CBS 393.64 / IMI 116815) TaxID=1408163 RepID=A0A0F4YEP7_RASE3|nr:hypothetical protein T310_9737 [Rasamsonia emersonii CBS 393.64]KKA16619.1 hypothetical protein T310_9737 [Rasamsonia emersonii CBS 393.64]
MQDVCTGTPSNGHEIGKRQAKTTEWRIYYKYRYMVGTSRFGRHPIKPSSSRNNEEKRRRRGDTAKAPKQPVPQDDRRDLVAAVEWITSSGVATGGTDLVLIASTLRVGSWPSLSRQGRPEKTRIGRHVPAPMAPGRVTDATEADLTLGAGLRGRPEQAGRIVRQVVFLSWHRASVATRRWNHLVLTTAVHRNSPMAGKINEPQGNAESAFEYSDVVQFLPVQYDSRRDRAERIRTGVQSRKEPMRSNPARKQIGVVHPSASLVSVARRYRWGVTMTRAGTGCRLVGVTWRCDIGVLPWNMQTRKCRQPLVDLGFDIGRGRDRTFPIPQRCALNKWCVCAPDPRRVGDWANLTKDLSG